MGKQYILIAAGLRVQRGAGRADYTPTRPAVNASDSSGIRGFLDDPDTDPTIVEFDEFCQINVEKLISRGQLREYKRPRLSTRTPKTSSEGGEG